MEIKSTYKGKTVKVATITGCDVSTSADMLLDMALDFFKETKGTLFGWAVEFFDDGDAAKVSLHID